MSQVVSTNKATLYVEGRWGCLYNLENLRYRCGPTEKRKCPWQCFAIFAGNLEIAGTSNASVTRSASLDLVSDVEVEGYMRVRPSRF